MAWRPPSGSFADVIHRKLFGVPMAAPGGTTEFPPEWVRTPPRLPEQSESAFREWYAQQAQKTGINPNPDDPRHYYDYRAAFRSGAEPALSSEDKRLHWPSQFKLPGHPRLVLEGVDTRTGAAQRSPTAEVLREGSPRMLPEFRRPTGLQVHDFPKWRPSPEEEEQALAIGRGEPWSPYERMLPTAEAGAEESPLMRAARIAGYLIPGGAVAMPLLSKTPEAIRAAKEGVKRMLPMRGRFLGRGGARSMDIPLREEMAGAGLKRLEEAVRPVVEQYGTGSVTPGEALEGLLPPGQAPAALRSERFPQIFERLQGERVGPTPSSRGPLADADYLPEAEIMSERNLRLNRRLTGQGYSDIYEETGLPRTSAEEEMRVGQARAEAGRRGVMPPVTRRSAPGPARSTEMNPETRAAWNELDPADQQRMIEAGVALPDTPSRPLNIPSEGAALGGQASVDAYVTAFRQAMREGPESRIVGLIRDVIGEGGSPLMDQIEAGLARAGVSSGGLERLRDIAQRSTLSRSAEQMARDVPQPSVTLHAPGQPYHGERVRVVGPAPEVYGPYPDVPYTRVALTDPATGMEREFVVPREAVEWGQRRGGQQFREAAQGPESLERQAADWPAHWPRPGTAEYERDVAAAAQVLGEGPPRTAGTSRTEMGQVAGTAEGIERAADRAPVRQELTLRGAPPGQRQRPLDIPPVWAEVAVYPRHGDFPGAGIPVAYNFERGRFLGPGTEPGQFRVEVGGTEQVVPGNRVSIRGRLLSEARPLDVPPTGGAAMPEAAPRRPVAPGSARLEPGAEIMFHPTLYDPATPGQYVRADPSQPGFHIVRGADGREVSIPAARIEGAP